MSKAADKITALAANCDARFMSSGVGFDAASWNRFVEALSLMLPDGTHERIFDHSQGGSVDLFYEKAPLPETYDFISSFCNFQSAYRRRADPGAPA
jgi:hypothetical protein